MAVDQRAVARGPVCRPCTHPEEFRQGLDKAQGTGCGGQAHWRDTLGESFGELLDVEDSGEMSQKIETGVTGTEVFVALWVTGMSSE